MGAFFTNLHVRKVSAKAICDALPQFTRARAYVSPPRNGWVTVYPEATEDQNENTIRAIAGGLSHALQADVLAFLVHDSDIAVYWLYRNGRLTDEFDSAPDYFGQHISEKTRARVRGNPEALLPLCAGATRAQLDAALHPPEDHATVAEEIVAGLARLLGVDTERAVLGFKNFDDEAAEVLPDVADFEPVGPNAARKAVPAAAVARAATPPRAEISLPDSYPIAINMLTQIWFSKYERGGPQFMKMFGKNTEELTKQMRDAFDKSARELLKKSAVPGRPTFDELRDARNSGPEALAELIVKRTPSQLTEIGIGATVYGLEAFVAALLRHGLDPNAANPARRTTLGAAEQHGKDSAIYRLVKTAADPHSTAGKRGKSSGWMLDSRING